MNIIAIPTFLRSRAKLSLIFKVALTSILIYFVLIHSVWKSLVTSGHTSDAQFRDIEIPQKIWQTWHTPSTSLADEDKQRVQTWMDKNPHHQYELLTDGGAESYIRQHFAENSLIRDVFLKLTDAILRADYLRYLILLAEGGVYADLDVECREPIDAWIPPAFQRIASVVLGIETDRKPVENDVKLYYDHREYIWGVTNWTFMSKRGHPFLRFVAETVAKNLQEVARQQERTLSTMKLSYKEVIDSTGPRAFTEAFLAYALKATGASFMYENATMLEEPKLIGDILLLPIRAFSSSEASRDDVEGAHSNGWPTVIYHWSAGTWKKTHYQKPEGPEIKAEG